MVVTPGEHESKRYVEEAVGDPVHVPANAGADKERTAADQGQMSLESPTNVPSEREGDSVTTMEDHLSEQKGPEDTPGNESQRT